MKKNFLEKTSQTEYKRKLLFIGGVALLTLFFVISFACIANASQVEGINNGLISLGRQAAKLATGIAFFMAILIFLGCMINRRTRDWAISHAMGLIIGYMGVAFIDLIMAGLSSSFGI